MLKAVFVALLCASSGLTADDSNEPEQEDKEQRLTITGSKLTKDSKRTQLAEIVTEQELELREHTHISEALSGVSGVWISRGNGQEHLTAIRSPVLTGAGACGAFMMAEDDIPLRAAGFCNINQLFDSHSEQALNIDILKGPGSVLYGSNALHGAINNILPRPSAIDNQVSLEAGSYDFYRIKLRAASEHNQGHQWGSLLSLSSDGGYQDASGYAQQKVSLLHDYRSDNFQARTTLTETNLNQETAGFIQGYQSYQDTSLRKSNPNPEAFRDSMSRRLYSKLSWEHDETSFHLTPYYRHTEMRFIQHFLPWKAIEENSQSSLGLMSEFRQSTENFSYSIGVDLEFTNARLSEFQPEPFSPNIPEGMHYDYRVDAANLSIYADGLWTLANDWYLTLGARLDQLDYNYNNQLSDGSACALGVNNCRFTRPSDSEDDYLELSPRLAVSHKLNSDSHLQLILSRGFRAPQATELYRLQAGQTRADLDSVKLDAIELKYLTDYSDFSYELSVYDMAKDNVIFQDSNRLYVGSGKSSHQGVDLDTRWAINENWQFDANLSYARHRYANNLDIASQNIDGLRVDTAPDWQAALRVSWLPDSGSLWQLEWQYLGSYYLEPTNQFSYPGHKLWHLRGRIPLNDKISFTLRLNNLLDEDYAERADYAFGNYRYFVGLPRTLFIGLELGF